VSHGTALTSLCAARLQVASPGNTYGGAALHMAAERAWPEMVELLIRLGCPLGLTRLGQPAQLGQPAADPLPGSGATAMHVVAAEADCEPGEAEQAVMQALADAAAAAEPPLNLVTAPDDDGAQPLHWAAEWAKGKTAALNFLLERGAPVDARDKEGCTALHIAVNEVRG